MPRVPAALRAPSGTTSLDFAVTEAGLTGGVFRIRTGEPFPLEPMDESAVLGSKFSCSSTLSCAPEFSRLTLFGPVLEGAWAALLGGLSKKTRERVWATV